MFPFQTLPISIDKEMQKISNKYNTDQGTRDSRNTAPWDFLELIRYKPRLNCLIWWQFTYSC